MIEPIAYFFILSMRIAGFFIIFPTIINIPPSIRLVMVMAIAMMIYVNVDYTSIANIESSISILYGILYEFVVGLFLGIFASLPLIIISLAGFYISQSCAISNVLFPDENNEHNSVITTFLKATGLVCIFASGSFTKIIEGLGYSYSVYNMNTVALDNLSVGMIKLGSIYFQSAFNFAIPFFIITIMAYMLMMFINRMSPRVSIIFVAMPMQIIVGFAVLYMLNQYIIQHFMDDFIKLAFLPYTSS